MKFAGRRVVVSKLDPVPELLRVGSDVVVMNEREIAAIKEGAGQAIADDLREAIKVYDRARLQKILEDAGR